MITPDTRILVTGGAGFIGSHVVDRLVKRTNFVTVIDDLSTGNSENLDGPASRIEFRKQDLRSAIEEPRFVDGFDLIFHLAGNPYIPPSVERPAYDFGLNLENTFFLLEALRTGARRTGLVFASSAAVYGNPARLPIRESDPTVPISPYGVSKLAAERYVDVYSKLYGIPARSVRLFSVYGPRQHKQVVFDLLARLERDPSTLNVIGDGTQARDFAFVGDVADALIAVAEKSPGLGEAYNVAFGATHSIADLVAELSDSLGVSPEVTFTGEVRPGDAQRWEVDITALRSLGFAPRTNLAAGLAATRDWYRGGRRG